ncbi:hypothetical protein [Mesorhizobium mediterraneum]|uniref:hypothetical protein n=1 Tax=Mesorhizobium mediterraneum TaxID=43617 RepID=UPI00178161D8|nr:hypothetical protein [Mesorhizobium mediterraneum]
MPRATPASRPASSAAVAASDYFKAMVIGTAMQHALHGQRALGTAETPGETFLPFDIYLLENK